MAAYGFYEFLLDAQTNPALISQFLVTCRRAEKEQDPKKFLMDWFHNLLAKQYKGIDEPTCEKILEYRKYHPALDAGPDAY